MDQLRICVIFLIICSLNTLVLNCNESICASIVTKCLLMDLCKCDPNNSTCNMKCFVCLKQYYSDCCSCVDACYLETNELVQKNEVSFIEALDNPIPALFKALAQEPRRDDSWTSETIRLKIDLSRHIAGKTWNFQMISHGTRIEKGGNFFIADCTVIFKNECIGIDRCKNICLTMGSSGYRWFHNGCCQCLGESCYNFGLSEGKCKYCSFNKDNPKSEHEAYFDDDLLNDNYFDGL
ncbi:hypothetical protein WA026_020747 [Henosepilachna vigintioctopunctata]|uniref:Uncharacterized protein n=1 Tax=Henosepilachna vigintioctopunctata TaxID=420089 RepID=A0AAW1UDG1_9CUCU